MDDRPGFANNERGDAPFAQEGAGGVELGEGGGRLLDAPRLQMSGDVPHDTGTVDVDGDGVDAAVIGKLVDEALGEHVEPAFLLVEPGEVLHTVGDDPRTDQFLPRVNLKAIRRVIAEHAGFEDGAEVDACATRDGGVDDFDAGVLLLVVFDERCQSRTFVACPPREYFQPAAWSFVLRCRAADE